MGLRTSTFVFGGFKKHRTPPPKKESHVFNPQSYSHSHCSHLHFWRCPPVVFSCWYSGWGSSADVSDGWAVAKASTALDSGEAFVVAFRKSERLASVALTRVMVSPSDKFPLWLADISSASGGSAGCCVRARADSSSSSNGARSLCLTRGKFTPFRLGVDKNGVDVKRIRWGSGPMLIYIVDLKNYVDFQQIKITIITLGQDFANNFIDMMF